MPKSRSKVANKEYLLKVPVFTSERIEIKNSLYGFTYNDAIEQIKYKIEEHNKRNVKVTSSRKNKTIKREIGDVVIHEARLDTIPYLLLQVSAYNTNLEGCIVSNEKTVDITNDDKIGSNNNFILLYPQFVGIENQSMFWIILVYDDPKKDSYDNISTAKIVLSEILNCKIRCIKLPILLDKIKTEKILPKITMNLSAINFDNEGEIKFKNYLTHFKIFRKEEYEYDKMPFDEIESLLKSSFDGFKQRVVKMLFNNQEYKITQEFKGDTQNLINDMVEQSFNLSTKIIEEDLDKIYNIEFVTNRLIKDLGSYLKNGNDKV